MFWYRDHRGKLVGIATAPHFRGTRFDYYGPGYLVITPPAALAAQPGEGQQ
jgi:hypothetical protein